MFHKIPQQLEATGLNGQCTNKKINFVASLCVYI